MASETQAGTSAPLAGVTIVDLSVGLAGPVATRLLAEAGARVVKLEPPEGDWTRELVPAAFATWNRSKEGAVVDLDSPGDLEALAGLLRTADVLVHGMTQREAALYGLDDGSLADKYESLVVASLTGYPDHHRDAGRSSHEILVQARLGAMDEQQGLRSGPTFVRMPFASWTAAYLLAGGIVSRLIERTTSRHTKPIHTSILQGALAPASLYWQRAERPPPWMSRHTLRRDDHPSSMTIFQCADDRWIHVLGGFTASEPIRQLLESMGRSDLAAKPVTLENRAPWVELFMTKSVDDWLALLWPVGVIAMPILDVGEVLAYEQARENGYAVPVADERFGQTIQAGSPIQFIPAPEVSAGAPWTSRQLHDIERPPPRRSDSSGPALAEPASAGSLAGGSLSGIRALDFGAYVAGPFGGQCLADFGADVIKVEPPWGERGRTINQFTGCQRGKRSLAVDLQHPLAKEVLRRLVASADVVMHNVRESAAARLAIDEASIHAVNPRAVYAHSSAWGVNGPWASFAAFDPAACAVGGWSEALTAPGDRPTWLRNSTMDTDTGIALYLASLLGLYRRVGTGVGGSLRTSMLGVAVLSGSEVLYQCDDHTLSPFRSIDHAETGLSPYYRIYAVSDRWIAVAATTVAEHEALRAAFGVEPGPDLEILLRDRDINEVEATLVRAGVPAEIVAQDNRDRFFDQEIAADSGLIARLRTKPYGWFEAPAGYWSDDIGVVRGDLPIPDIGEHTIEILRELDFTEAEIQELLDSRVVSTEQIDPPKGRVFNLITKSLATHAD